MPELIRYAVDRSMATITFDSPANRNALSRQLVTETTECLTEASDDDDVRAVVLTHEGSTFCAGADLKEQSAEGGPEAGTHRVLELLRSIVALPKPVIARVDGNVRAGGVGVVGACDIALAGPSASFAFTEVRLGLAPAIISLTTLGRMTERAAGRYYLTGEVFGPDDAERCGLVTVSTDALDDTLDSIADALRSCSPQGLAESKPLTTRALRAGFDACADDVQSQSARLFASEEAREGMAAFLEKRPPRWVVP